MRALSLLSLLTLCLAACEEPEIRSTLTPPTVTDQPTGTPYGTQASALRLVWSTEPVALDATAAPQDVSVALAAGNAWVSYERPLLAVRTMLLDPTGLATYVEDTPLQSAPRISGGEHGVFGIAVGLGGGITANSWSPTGALAGEPLTLDQAGDFGDIAVDDLGGFAAWSLRAVEHCAGWEGSALDPIPVPCLERLDPDRSVASIAVDLDPAGWVAWSESSPGQASVIGLGHCTSSGVGATAEAEVVYEHSFDARPDVAGTRTGGLLVWRGAEQPSVPRQAWISAFTSPEDLLPSRPLGGPESDRPAVVADGPIGVVAWEEGGDVWIELVDSVSGEPVWGPQIASEGTAAGPALALESTPDGWRGLVGWEGTTGGARWFEITE